MALTHKNLLKGNNLNAVISLIKAFDSVGMTNSDLWIKLENLLEH